MSIEEAAGWTAMIAATLAGRYIARRSAPESRSAFVGWAGGAFAAASAFVFGLCMFPPIVVDSLMVLVQLPFIGGLAGAAAEVFGQVYDLCLRRQLWPRAIRNVAVMVLVGAASYGALALYEWNHHRQWETNPPTIDL